MNLVLPKTVIIRDDKWIEFLKTEPDLLTGMRATEFDAVDPLHIGTLGKGIKSSDDEVLPILHSFHQKGHQSGEISMFRKYMPDWLLRECLRLYARKMYAEWRASQAEAPARSSITPEVSHD